MNSWLAEYRKRTNGINFPSSIPFHPSTPNSMALKNESKPDSVLTQLSGEEGGDVDCYFILTFRNLSRGTIFLIVERVRGMWESGIPLNLGPLPNLIIQIYSQYFHLQHSRFPHLRVRFCSVFHYKATLSRTQHGA